MDHSLNLNSIENARELGGYPIGGKRIKEGLLLRTGSLSNASEEDLIRLRDVYKVGCIIDMRMSYEKMGAPDPALEGAANLSLSIFEPQDFEGIDPSMLLRDGKPVDRQSMLKIAIDKGFVNDKLYVSFLFSPRGKSAYRDFFKTLLELPEGASILWHCTDGKDRTGLASMLTLSALGATRETILEDYLLTNTYNEKKIMKAKAYADSLGVPEKMRDIVVFTGGAVYEDYMVNALDAMDSAYGSAAAYMEKELGVGADEREFLCNRYLI